MQKVHQGEREGDASNNGKPGFVVIFHAAPLRDTI